MGLQITVQKLMIPTYNIHDTNNSILFEELIQLPQLSRDLFFMHWKIIHGGVGKSVHRVTSSFSSQWINFNDSSAYSLRFRRFISWDIFRSLKSETRNADEKVWSNLCECSDQYPGWYKVWVEKSQKWIGEGGWLNMKRRRRRRRGYQGWIKLQCEG